MSKVIPPVRTCILRVGIKCCKGCQTNAKRKLLSVSGVSAVEYNAEEGLLTVSGDVNPTTLLTKLAKWGKKAELISVLGDISTPQHNHNQKPDYLHNIEQRKTMEKQKKKKATKCCIFLKCFGKRRSKAKVEPLSHYPVRGDENGNVMPFIVPPPPPPPMVYPPPQAVPSFATPIPYPPPNFGAPPPSPPYFQLRQTQFPHMVNSRLHYQHHH